MNDTPTSASVERRDFLKSTALGGAAIVLPGAFVSAAEKDSDSERVVVGVMGLSRGRSLATTFARQPNVTVKYLCDVDETRRASCMDLISKMDGQEPESIGDFRKILDDPEVDALVCAAPNHWHAPATILGCQAGKHVYVEKPCSHNPREGELMIEAARKHKRAVQMGTQRRSGIGITEAMKAIHSGAIGDVYYSRGWYANIRGSIGVGQPAEVPAQLDFELWQGPAPRVQYIDNLVHYNWHWRWDWGNGELGNNGVHALDLCRWGLGVEYPTRVTSSGGRYAFDDDQQTPDTHIVNFEFPGGKQAMWEGLSCNRMGVNRSGFGVTFHGQDGTIELTDGGFVQYDKRGKELKKVGGNRGDNEHIANFVSAIRQDDPSILNQGIESAHKSTLLCHLGNIAHRTGRALNCSPENGHIQGDKEAASLWAREYANGWEPTV
ncbi:Gfo/Idh/MocA family oxidoreductase [Thalassoroseus pseudoceratinae]|uniref:Gfo/Idh/MocA family oxidoreductase n=1 Tax=Thalassoroseus pseudoceratinae TaxID=2713176 RepID=UPI00142239EB|nr:Gfo/Idh/MocA family oxidoreductase [Thalassoroseus pseudoceratinae]